MFEGEEDRLGIPPIKGGFDGTGVDTMGCCNSFRSALRSLVSPSAGPTLMFTSYTITARDVRSIDARERLSYNCSCAGLASLRMGLRL